MDESGRLKEGVCAAGEGSAREAVRSYYGARAAFDGPDDEGTTIRGPALGCGNPLDLADLRPGEDVLDLGSGAGREVIEAAARVAPGGVAYGLDMTDEMLALALENRRRAKASNAVFLRGSMESIPLPDASVDVIISNCVINLSTDKPAVMREMYRVLRPGGRLAVYDTVTDRPVDESAKADAALWCACMSGAPQPDEYRRLLEDAGFSRVDVGVAGWGTGDVGCRDFRVGSAFISAIRPSSAPKTFAAPVPAAREDLPEILKLLGDAGLPVEGVGEALGSFTVMRDPEGLVAGVGAVEFYGRQALLRSLCVRPDLRDKGFGARLAAALLRLAAERRCGEVYLLTTSAEGYAEKLGFRRVERSQVTGPVSGSSQFAGTCPDTATVMRYDLKCCC